MRAALEITSPANPRIKQLVALRRRRARDEAGVTLVEGAAELSLALAAGVRPATLYYCPELSGDGDPDIAGLASAAGATLLLNPSPFRPLPGSLLHAVDVLIVNEVEAAQLAGDDDGQPAGVTGLRKALAARGITRAVITRGAAGSLVLDGDAVTEIPATPAKAIDTTGAGDAFTGALAVGLTTGHSLAEAAARASVAAAGSTTRRGAQPSYPTQEELECFLQAATQH
jgi:ribokinase